MAETSATPTPPAVVEVTGDDLPVCCPPREVDPAPLHPRVWLPVKQNGGHAACPYCGTEYRLGS
ncbi:MAG TPA: zinc-finger domain-containing protein [Sedimenticola sp.]|nr:zinc-finger domain-containing protein [Sedimenticola sp.]